MEFGRVYILEVGDFVKIGNSYNIKSRYSRLKTNYNRFGKNLGRMCFSINHFNYLSNERLLHEVFKERRTNLSECFDISFDEALKELNKLKFERLSSFKLDVNFFNRFLIHADDYSLEDLKLRLKMYGFESISINSGVSIACIDTFVKKDKIELDSLMKLMDFFLKIEHPYKKSKTKLSRKRAEIDVLKNVLKLNKYYWCI